MYSVHSSVFTKCGFIMRPILISEDDDALFNANFTPRVAVTYQNHVKEIRRMVKQQGVGFWIRFITSFRSHNERHRLMDGIVFPRAEAVFVDMLHLLTCGDNLNELTRLVASLRAMQAAITANDYHVLLDPVLRVLMTCYDKPLDGLRLYFRFVAGLVVMFRRWRQVAWRSKKDSDTLLPWEPPLHWQEMTGRDYSEWTFEGHLLCMYGPELPHILTLPPGLPCWMPDELKAGHMLYPAIAMEEIPVLQDMNARGNRNKKKCRRRKNRQFEEGFTGYEQYPANVTPTSGDSGVCLLEQGQDAVAIDLLESQNAVVSGGIAGSFSNAMKEEHAMFTVKEPTSSVMNETDSMDVLNRNLPSDVPQNCETSVEIDKNALSDKCMLPPHADVLLENPSSPRGSIEISGVNKGKDTEQEDVLTSGTCLRDLDDYVEESFTPYMSECDYCIIPENFPEDWKKCSPCNEDQFYHNRCFCNRSCQYGERPDLYVWESRGPGLVQNGQYGGLPVLEQNYGLPYDQCLHVYRRDGPPRIMLGPNNFRPNCQIEETPLGRATAWMEGPGNFAHSSPIGYFDAPVIDYMGPASDLRRRGQQNRRFRQKRGRQPTGLATIDECFDATTVSEQTSSDSNTMVQNEGISIPSANQKKPWHNKNKPELSETTTEVITEDSTNTKFSFADDTFNCSPPLEANVNVSPDTSSQESCSKGYALAVCGLLSKRSGKTSEIRKETGKQEENPKAETSNNKFAPCDKPNLKKFKGKPGKQLEEEGNEKFGKPAILINTLKDTEKGKRFPVKSESNNISTNDFGKMRPNKGKMTYKSSVSTDVGKTEKSGMDFEPNNSLTSSFGKDSKSNVEIARNNPPCQDEEKVMEKKRKWKSVWTRRREAEIHCPEEKLTAEGDVLREKEMNNRHNVDRRDGVPENVPDILKQVENSELKSFWKETYEAPKPQRKSRPKRDTRWKQGNQECISRSDFNQNTKKNDVTPVVTPVVKLDIVPAVEPKDKDNFSQDTNVQERSPQQHPSENCVSEIGWYEETLAEDKDREDQQEMGAPYVGESRNICGAKKNKNRKWKRKQRNNRKVKDEKSTVETLINERSTNTTDVEDTDRKKENDTETSEDIMQTKSTPNGNISQKLKDPAILANNIQKDEIVINGYTVSEVDVEQKNKILTKKATCKKQPTSCDKEIINNITACRETQNSNETSNQNVGCCKAILDDILLHLPENSEKTRKLSDEVMLTDAKLSKPKESVSSCSFIPDENLDSPPENNNNYFQIDIVEGQKKNNDLHLKQNAEKNGTHHQCLEMTTNSACKNAGYKVKEHDNTIVHRKRQACLAKTLKYLAAFKFSIPLPTKRHFLKFFFMNGEIIKAIENLPKRGIFITDPGCILSSRFPHHSGRSIGIPQPPPFVPKKKLLLRRCDNCNILEKSLGEYGECVRCKEIPIRLPRVYCNRMCQRLDWRRRHRAEHKRHDSEENFTKNDNSAFV